MKLASTLAIALLCLTGAVSDANAHPHRCSSKNLADCPFPPVPPVPPAPPAAPAPPMGELPTPPLPPMPPAPPVMPEAPRAAHAACAGKKDGSSMSFTFGKGRTMSGRCVMEGGKMVFDVESYFVDN